MEIKNRWITLKLLQLAQHLGQIEVVMYPKGHLPEVDGCEDCGGVLSSDDEWLVHICDAADILDEAYTGVPGYKSVSPGDNTMTVHLIDGVLLKYFPRVFMGVPIEFVLMGEHIGIQNQELDNPEELC